MPWVPNALEVPKVSKVSFCGLVLRGSARAEEVIALYESVNLDFIARIGCLRGSGLVLITVGGRSMTLRHALAQLAVRTCKRMPYQDLPELVGIGRIATYWREAATPQDVPTPTRRYSGLSDLEPLASHANKAHLDELVEFGLSPFMATVSPFAGPRVLRHITRFGLAGVDIDQSIGRPPCHGGPTPDFGAPPCLCRF